MTKPLMTPAELYLSRLALGLTNRELSSHLGIDGSTLSKWERGLHPMHDAAVKTVFQLISDQGKLVKDMRARREFSVPKSSGYLCATAMIAMLADPRVTVNWSDE